MSLSLLIFIGSFCGILTAFIGGQRGYSLALMYITGFVTGPLGIAIAFMLPNRSEDRPEDPKRVIKEQEQRSRMAA